MSKILIVYSTTDGQTKKICLKLKQLIEQVPNQVTVVSILDEPDIDVAVFDKIVIGASIRYGKHSRLVNKFIEKNKALLESKPNAFFSVNVVARKPEKNRPENNPYLQKFLKNISWHPQLIGVFAGKIDYPSYRFLDRLMIRLIMWMTKGPTDPNVTIEYTDWKQVEEFGHHIRSM